MMSEFRIHILVPECTVISNYIDTRILLISCYVTNNESYEKGM